MSVPRRVAILGSVLALLLFGVSTATAEAAYVLSNSGGAWIRARPTTNTYAYAYVNNYTGLYLYCYTDAQWTHGNYWTNRWFMVNVPTYRYGSPEAYIHASLVANQYPVPHC